MGYALAGRHRSDSPRAPPADRPLRLQRGRGDRDGRRVQDVLVPHIGLTTAHGAQEHTHASTSASGCIQAIQRGERINRSLSLVLFHDRGPIAEPDDAGLRARAHGGHHELLRRGLDGALADRDRDDRSCAASRRSRWSR